MLGSTKRIVLILVSCLFIGVTAGVVGYYVLRSTEQPVDVENDDNDNQIPDDEELVGSLEDSSSTATTYTGLECESTLATYCAPLQTREWMTWCTSQIESWRAVGVETINPCANSKYAKDSCVEAAILGNQDVAEECRDYHAALNSSSADVKDKCLYTTKPGGVCEGVKAAPVPPGTKPEDVVVPLDDCLEEHYTVLTAECQAAYDLHTAVSKSTTR